jgi:hypothetical protein
MVGKGSDRFRKAMIAANDPRARTFDDASFVSADQNIVGAQLQACRLSASR